MRIDFCEEGHIYEVDGKALPSVTSIIKDIRGEAYMGVSPKVLEEASAKGTQLHKAIEKLEKFGEESELKEVRNYKFLKKKYAFKTIGSEVKVVIKKEGEPVCAGTLDLLVEKDGTVGIGDIKRVARVDREYVTLQLNMYKKALEDTYGINVDFLFVLHLRGDTRKYIKIDIRDRIVSDIINEFFP